MSNEEQNIELNNEQHSEETQSSEMPAIIEPEPLITHNLQPITPMEVHHHPHVEKKSFKEYLLEGLMIFIAVSMGFIAEQIREHFADKEREHEYMHSFYQDLKTDTASLSNLIQKKMYDLVMYDSLFKIFRTKQYLKETSTAYYYGRRLVRLSLYYPTDGTLKQLENAGGLRLIRNREVVDSIQSYKRLNLFLKDMQEFEMQHFMAARIQIGKIFDANVFDEMIENNTTDILKKPEKNYPLMPFTNSELNDFHVPMNFMKRNKLTQIGFMKELQRKATNLMILLNKKYHLEHE